jgi:hypothetical protein
MERYNRLVDWPKYRKILAALAIPAIGWIVAPITKAWVDGTALNGLLGMWAFWRGVAGKPMPAWLGVVAALAAALIVVAATKRKKRRGYKTELRIVILPTPPPWWGIGAWRRPRRTLRVWTGKSLLIGRWTWPPALRRSRTLLQLT